MGCDLGTIKLINVMKKRENGQALVLVLLSLSVVLTMVLYILSRSVTDIAVSGNQEEAVRAFSAAEAGIEKALVIGSNLHDIAIGTGGAYYNADVSGMAQGSTEFAYPTPLSSGDSATFWLAGHDASGNLTSTGAFTGNSLIVCWGASGTSGSLSTTPAVEVSLYYETTANNLGTIKISRWALDPFSGRTPPNSFSSALDGGTCNFTGGQIYAFKKTLTSLPVNLLLVRVRMFYNDVPQNVGISLPNGYLPSQGQNISSTGVAGGSNRKITLFTGWPEFPFVSNAVFSPNGVTK